MLNTKKYNKKKKIGTIIELRFETKMLKKQCMKLSFQKKWILLIFIDQIILIWCVLKMGLIFWQIFFSKYLKILLHLI